MQQTIRLPEAGSSAAPWAGTPAPKAAPQAPGSTWSDQGADPFAQPGVPDSTFGDPYAPAAPAKNGPGTGARVLGIVVGLLLGLGGFVAVLLGQASPKSNTITASVFIGGVVLLAVAALLGSWTAAVPITAGLTGALPGLFGVIAPQTWADLVDKLPTIDVKVLEVPANVAIGALGTHVPAAAGVLLVVAGVTTVLGRRRGATAARQD